MERMSNYGVYPIKVRYFYKMGVSIATVADCVVCVAYLSPFVQNQPRIWPKDYFDKAPPKRLDHPDEASFHAVCDARHEVEQFFRRQICDHIQACARVVGMIAQMTNGNPTVVGDSATMGTSLRNDWTPLNIKRACFVLHFSINNSYLSLFKETFYQQMERKFMTETNTKYSGCPVSSSGGCINGMGSKVMNSIKWTLEKNLDNLPVRFSVRKPKGWTLGEFNGGGKDRANNQFYVTVAHGQYMVSW